MDPSIRFCTSADGTQVAYAILGQGRPILHVAGFSTNFEIEWKDPECRAWMERIATQRMLVRVERRGTGGSQRDVTDVSLESQVKDLTAVMDHLGLERADFFAAYDGVASVLAYAAEQPRRISGLVLFGAYARGLEVNDAQSYDALATLAKQNWRLFLRTWSNLCFPSGPPERQRWYSELVRHTVSVEVAVRYIEFMRDLDVTDIARQLEVPAMVLHRGGDSYTPPRLGRALAAILPHATFIPLEGDIGLPVVGDSGYLERE